MVINFSHLRRICIFGRKQIALEIPYFPKCYCKTWHLARLFQNLVLTSFKFSSIWDRSRKLFKIKLKNHSQFRTWKQYYLLFIYFYYWFYIVNSVFYLLCALQCYIKAVMCENVLNNNSSYKKQYSCWSSQAGVKFDSTSD